MNWVLGLIGALLGLAISDEHWLLGMVLGFFGAFLTGSMAQLRRRLGVVERELAMARVAVVAQPVRQEPAAPTPAAAPAATSRPVVAEPFVQPAAAVVADIDASQAMPDAVPESADVAPMAASSPVQATVPVEPLAIPEVAPATRAPHQPGLVEKLAATIKRWFTEGNVPVKVGVLVFFVGIAAALRYAVAQGYFTLPIEVRLALIGGAGLAGLLFGWRERERRPAFGLSLQGGGLGVMMMTVFAAYKLYALLPPMAAFALVVVLVAGSALLAVLQDAIALAALGFLGGYLAPVLISTGSHDHVALFSYYAVLNAAVFGVSWKRSWRLLNLIGFAFTFGVGTAWGTQFYTPELFATVEPFLILFFVFYVTIGLLYVIRQTEHRRPWVDGTLVFGTPLLAFPLQAGLLKDDRIGLAMSALVVAVVYSGLVYWLRRRRDERLLTDAYAALALTFATLAVPLAFSAGTTASVWALEGAGVAWVGIRQNRTFPWLAGLALQLLAAGAYILSEFNGPSLNAHADLLLLNPVWLGAALIAIGGYALNFVHDRLRPIRILPSVLFIWSTIWWLVAAATQANLEETLGIGDWRYLMGYFAGTILLAAVLRAWLPWSRLGRLIALCAVLALPTVFGYDHRFGGPFAPEAMVLWAAFVLALGWALWSTRAESSRSMALAHLMGLWTLVLATSVQADHLAEAWHLANGWDVAMSFAPLVFATFVLWRRPNVLAWPRAELFANYRIGWFAPAGVLLGIAFLASLFAEGDVAPIGYLPLLNPIDLSALAILALLYGLCEGKLLVLRKFWPYAGFALVTSATLRTVYHWDGHGVAWSMDILDLGVSQMALTLVWSLLGVASWIAGSKRGDRRLWIGGAVLMGVVLLKLIAVDRHYMGDMPGIASFVVVGLLMMGVGYIAPAPPKRPGEPTTDAAGEDKLETT
ncbi:MAG TPA: DUF2339 domain-containing protein [Xanthomonadaceae bacterium]|nr:DUF2339 domain-containing protein [Xanthomonadaceae bacterium]